MLSNEKWFGASAGFYPETIEQSLRFDGSTSKLEKTPSSDGNRKKWTSSWWVKRAKLGALQYMWSGASYSGNDGISAIYFNTDDKIHMYFDSSGSAPYGAINSRVYRDVSQWYHIVWAVDAVNTVTRVWVNGVEETSSIQPPNYDYGMNKASTKMAFGIASWGGSPNYNGYCAEFVHLDGQYLDETYFGEFKNGVWIPKNIQDQNFTFGTNGFYLPFSDSSNIGYDYQTSDRSGTTNDYTATGLASTDVVLDSPTNNFCTLNILQTSNNASTFYFSEGNLGLNVTNNSGYRNCSATFSPMGIKGYFEFSVVTGTPNFYIGVIEDTTHPTNLDYADTTHNAVNLVHNGGVYQNEVIASQGNKIVRSSADFNIGTISTGDVLGMAFDFTGTNRRLWFHRANTYGTASGGVGNPSTGANPVITESYLDSSADYRFHFGINTGSGLQTVVFNFGQDGTFAGNETAQGNTDANGNGDFFYAVPTDFIALCSSSLSDTTLSPNQSEQATDYFSTVTYSGNSSNTHQITGVGFQPDWLWIKARNQTSAHCLVDSSRGLGTGDSMRGLVSNSTSAEFTAENDHVRSFDADGFTLDDNTDDTFYVNRSSDTYVAWNWKAGGTAPTKTYKVVVVSDSGNKYRFRNSTDSATFAQSAVTLDLQEGGTYTFDLSDSTMSGHPLRFSTTSDGTHGGGSEYTTGVTTSGTAGSAGATVTITVASSAPTLYYYCSNHSGMGGQIDTNTTFGQTNFDGSILSVQQQSTDAGFSIVTYTGTGSAGTIGHGLGKVPKWILIKDRDTARNWIVYHGENTSAPETDYLHLNTTNATQDSAIFFNDTAPTSSVISLGTGNNVNDSGNTYVAYVFAEIEGYSKFGTYTGNGSTDGTFVYTGFRPAWLMYKRTNTTGGWGMVDSKRDPINEVDNLLNAHLDSAESGTTSTDWDFLSNGFKAKNANSNQNYNGSTYIYMAFAEQPFKFSNAR